MSVEPELTTGCLLCYNTDSLEYEEKIGTYPKYKDTFGYALNDGTIGVHKAQFWPNFIKTINPQQTVFNSATLGILGTHHGAVAHRYVMPVGSESQAEPFYNPFPRVEMLLAFSALVVNGLDD